MLYLQFKVTTNCCPFHVGPSHHARLTCLCGDCGLRLGTSTSAFFGSSLSDELESLSDASELLPELDELLSIVARLDRDALRTQNVVSSERPGISVVRMDELDRTAHIVISRNLSPALKELCPHKNKTHHDQASVRKKVSDHGHVASILVSLTQFETLGVRVPVKKY